MEIASKYSVMQKEIKYPPLNITGEERLALIDEYNKKTNEVFRDFKKALFDHYLPMPNKKTHPKAEKTFNLAWEHGHSSGYNEVELLFSELAELVK